MAKQTAPAANREIPSVEGSNPSSPILLAAASRSAASARNRTARASQNMLAAASRSAASARNRTARAD